MILSDALCLLGFNIGLSFLWSLEMSYCVALKLYYIPYTVLYSMDIVRIDNNNIYLYTHKLYIYCIYAAVLSKLCFFLIVFIVPLRHQSTDSSVVKTHQEIILESPTIRYVQA